MNYVEQTFVLVLLIFSSTVLMVVANHEYLVFLEFISGKLLPK